MASDDDLPSEDALPSEDGLEAGEDSPEDGDGAESGDTDVDDLVSPPDEEAAGAFAPTFEDERLSFL